MLRTIRTGTWNGRTASAKWCAAKISRTKPSRKFSRTTPKRFTGLHRRCESEKIFYINDCHLEPFDCAQGKLHGRSFPKRFLDGVYPEYFEGPRNDKIQNKKRFERLEPFERFEPT